MLTLIYQSLRNRLSERVPALREIAWYRQQNTPGAAGSLKTLPAAFIRFNPVEVKTFPLGWQRATLTFDVIVMADNFRDGDERILDSDPAHSGQAIADQVYAALNDWNALFSDLFPPMAGTPDDYQLLNSITRTGITASHENAPVLETVQSFTCLAVDASNVKRYRRPTQTVLNGIMASLLAGQGLSVSLIDSLEDPF